MADHIRLTGLAFFGRHGVDPAERHLGQRIVVDLDLELDLGAAGASDSLDDTVDYAAVYQQVQTIVEGPSLNLLETLAARLAEALLAAHPRLTGVTVTVHKPVAPLATAAAVDAAVQITRRRP